jgi:hypothetical protein
VIGPGKEKTVNTSGWLLNLTAFAVLIPSPASAREFEVTVNFAENCAVPAGNRNLALKTATELFVPTGVKIRFMTSKNWDGSDDAIWVRLIKRAPREVGERVLGAAIMDRQPRAALVFCDRVMEFTDIPQWKDTGILLGYAIAHELGHLLRNEPGHSVTGIMKANWKRTDIVPMLQRALAFSSEDRAQIQIGLAAQDRTRHLAARAK